MATEITTQPYILRINGVSYGPDSANDVVMDWSLTRGMRETGELYVKLERNPAGYGISVGDDVEYYYISGGNQRLWTGQVRVTGETPMGDLELLCHDKLAHFEGATLDRLFYDDMEWDQTLAVSSGWSIYPVAKIPNQSWVKPLRQVIPESWDYFLPTKQPTYRDPQPPTGLPPFHIDLDTGGVFDTCSINFVPANLQREIRYSVYFRAYRTDTTDHLWIDWRLIRVDKPNGQTHSNLGAPPAIPADAIIDSGQMWIVTANQGVYMWHTIALLGGWVLDPNGVYTLEMIPRTTGGQTWAIDMPYEPLASSSPSRGMEIRDGSSGLWGPFMSSQAYIRYTENTFLEALQEGRDYSIVQEPSPPNDWYLQFDKSYQPVANQDTIQVLAISGTVGLDTILDKLCEAAGLDYTSTVAVSVPYVDATGITIRDLLNDVILDQLDVFAYTHTHGEVLFAEVPDAVFPVALSFDMGESGDDSRARIVSHTLSKDQSDAFSEVEIRSEGVTASPTLYRQGSSLIDTLDFNSSGTINPGFHSVKLIERGGFLTVEQMVAIAQFELERQQYDVWMGDITVDGVWADVGVGSIIAIRDDSIGLASQAFLITREVRKWHTTTWTVTRYPKDLLESVRGLDRRLNQQERLSVPDDSERTISIPLTYKGAGTLVRQTYFWARLEDSSNQAVSQWVRMVDYYAYPEVWPPDRLFASFYFAPNVEQGQYDAARQSKDVHHLRFSDDPSNTGPPPTEIIVPIPDLYGPKEPDMGWLIILKIYDSSTPSPPYP